MLEVEGAKCLSVRALTGGVKAALEVSVGKGLRMRGGGLRFLVIR
jgi:hypothetical protein